jgi:hypothetical protein
MKVMFECDQPELFDYVLKAFKKAKEFDESSWDVAQLVRTRNSATYITCCGNKYILRRRKVNGKTVVRFGYEGTRAGLIRLQPFAEWMKWGGMAPNGGELAVKIEGKWVLFTLRLVEYKTTTPKRWSVAWYEQIEKMLEKPGYAVIMAGPYSPRRVVKYRDVYHPARRRGNYCETRGA